MDGPVLLCPICVQCVHHLAQDEWPRVSQPCASWLAGQHQPQFQQEHTQSQTHAEGGMLPASGQQQQPKECQQNQIDAAMVCWGGRLALGVGIEMLGNLSQSTFENWTVSQWYLVKREQEYLAEHWEAML
eukprot:1159797-Pelagomonas_calceolata.AAC.9